MNSRSSALVAVSIREQVKLFSQFYFPVALPHSHRALLKHCITTLATAHKNEYIDEPNPVSPSQGFCGQLYTFSTKGLMQIASFVFSSVTTSTQNTVRMRDVARSCEDVRSVYI